MKIGVISDTHNYLDPRVFELFAEAEHILHAGDIGQPKILIELEQIAPVTAVSGNTDDVAFLYRLTEVIELAERKFLLHHIVHPHHLEESLKARVQRDDPDVVVFGHTHKPFVEVIGGILYLNPGYAGKSRVGMKRSVAILDCDGAVRPEFLALD